jgi:hypothetical protein
MTVNVSTGKFNALSSFRYWLETNVPPTSVTPNWTYTFLQQLTNTSFPIVQVTEYMSPDPGSDSLGMIVAPYAVYPSSAPATEGSPQRMGVKISIQDDITVDVNALQTIYQIRDQIRHALILAGQANDATGAVAIPNVEIMDYAQSPALDTGFSVEIEDEAGSIIERYIPPDETTPNLHTVELLVRLGWMEMN